MTAFVTGGTGFLGKRIVQRLLGRGDTVKVLARSPEKAAELAAAGAEVVQGDLSDVDAFKDALAGCDIVYHVGARVETSGEWDSFLDANVVATEKLIDYALEAGAKRFVYVSSLGIFEIPRDGVTVDEHTDYDHQPMLRGYYTRSKINGDRVAKSAAAVGKPVVIVRPGQIYGHDHPQGSPVYMGRVSKRVGPFLVVVGSSDYHPPTIFVENAADAIVAAGDADGVDGEIFNFVDDSDLRHREYFDVVTEVEGYPKRVIYLPVDLFMPAVSVVNTLFKVLKRRAWSAAYQLKRSGLNARYSTDAAREKLGWTPKHDWRRAVKEAASGGPK